MVSRVDLAPEIDNPLHQIDPVVNHSEHEQGVSRCRVVDVLQRKSPIERLFPLLFLRFLLCLLRFHLALHLALDLRRILFSRDTEHLLDDSLLLVFGICGIWVSKFVLLDCRLALIFVT